jgi:hypothetical protein
LDAARVCEILKAPTKAASRRCQGIFFLILLLSERAENNNQAAEAAGKVRRRPLAPHCQRPCIN